MAASASWSFSFAQPTWLQSNRLWRISNGSHTPMLTTFECLQNCAPFAGRLTSPYASSDGHGGRVCALEKSHGSACASLGPETMNGHSLFACANLQTPLVVLAAYRTGRSDLDPNMRQTPSARRTVTAPLRVGPSWLSGRVQEPLLLCSRTHDDQSFRSRRSSVRATLSSRDTLCGTHGFDRRATKQLSSVS